jgi:hypothetical protein
MNQENISNCIFSFTIIAIIGGIFTVCYIDTTNKRETQLECIKLVANKPAAEIVVVCK